MKRRESTGYSLKHQNVFPMNENDLGHTHLVDHNIDMGNARPIKQPPNHFQMAFEDKDCKGLAKLQAKGVI